MNLVSFRVATRGPQAVVNVPAPQQVVKYGRHLIVTTHDAFADRGAGEHEYIMSLKQRRRQPELMDDPALAPEVHRNALNGLRRINQLCRIASVLERAIARNCELTASAGPLRILDVASGGGDLAIQLANRFRGRNIDVQIEGCDISATAAEFARQQALRAGCNNVKFFEHNALVDELPADSYDVVMCLLFMHHLDEPDALRLLRFMKHTAKKLVLVDDLQRSTLGYWLAWLGCRLLTRSPIVHVDGPLSVEGAFTVSEATELAWQAGLEGPKFSTHWPERFLMTWKVQP